MAKTKYIPAWSMIRFLEQFDDTNIPLNKLTRFIKSLLIFEKCFFRDPHTNLTYVVNLHKEELNSNTVLTPSALHISFAFQTGLVATCRQMTVKYLLEHGNILSNSSETMTPDVPPRPIRRNIMIASVNNKKHFFVIFNPLGHDVENPVTNKYGILVPQHMYENIQEILDKADASFARAQLAVHLSGGEGIDIEEIVHVRDHPYKILSFVQMTADESELDIDLSKDYICWKQQDGFSMIDVPTLS